MSRKPSKTTPVRIVWAPPHWVTYLIHEGPQVSEIFVENNNTTEIVANDQWVKTDRSDNMAARIKPKTAAAKAATLSDTVKAGEDIINDANEKANADVAVDAEIPPGLDRRKNKPKAEDVDDNGEPEDTEGEPESEPESKLEKKSRPRVKVAETDKPEAKPRVKTKKPAEKKPETKKRVAAKPEKKTATKVKEKPTVTAKKAARGSKLEIIAGLLKRKGGCTANQVKEAVSWLAVNMHAQAEAAGITLSMEKRGRVTWYSAK